MTERFPTHPLFTVRTDALAGRREEQQKLRAAVKQLHETNDETRLFYIAGDGGMGKTRLLEWLENDIAKQPAAQESTTILCTNIIDFYSSHVRIDLDLIEAIGKDVQEKLGDQYEAGKILQKYNDLLEMFRSQQNQGVPTNIRREVMTAFDAAWGELAGQGCRLVVLLDTAELLRFHDDPVRKRFNALLPSAAAWNWLQRTVKENKLPGVLFVIAGRRQEAPELYDELVDLAATEERIIRLGGFSEEGVIEYIQNLSDTLKKHRYDSESERLSEGAGFDTDLARVFHRLTGGTPIALAIALQLYLDQTPPELLALVDHLLEGKEPPEDMKAIVRQTLVNALGRYAFGLEASIIVRYMALARRGLTPERFRAIWQGGHPFSNLDEDFQLLSRQIFIKIRPDGSLVLHDEIADWLENGFFDGKEQESTGIFERLVKAYDQEIKETETKIAGFNERTTISDEEFREEDLQTSGSADATRNRPLTLEQKEDAKKLFEAREQRRRLVSDRMSYALRWDPGQGYKTYYELAEEVFSTGLREHEAHLRAVFLEWWDEQNAGTDDYRYRPTAAACGVTEDLIAGDFALRAVQRTYTDRKPMAEGMGRAIDLVERMLAADDFTIPLHTKALLRVYASLCRGLLEEKASLEDVRRDFEACLQTLAAERGRHGEWKEDLQGWLIHAARAFGYYAYGFAERHRGNFGLAARHYTASIKHYGDLKFEINMARSLNDKAYVLAQVGDSVKAESAVKHALELRQRLGYGYPIALSLNTYGIVLTLTERPVSAGFYCKRALEICRRVGSREGQELALRALSEAHRRDAERLPLDREHHLKRLEDALEASEQAYEIANELFHPPNSRLADVIDEYGCVYRDLASFCWRNRHQCGDKYNASESFQEAERLLKEAIQAVAGIEASERQVDSAINLAYLQFWRRYDDESEQAELESYFDEAETGLSEAIECVPEEFRNPAHSGHPQKEVLTSYWAHLSKAWSLAAQIAQQRRLLTTDKEEQKRQEDMLAGAVIRILYFADRLPGNVRVVRRARQAAYDVLKTLSSDTLEALYKGERIFPAAEGEAWQEGVASFHKFLQNNFGVGLDDLAY